MKESEFKDLWDVELGATYIPWSKVPDNLEQLAEGAFIDDESLPESVRSNCAFYRAMHYSAKRGIAIACRLSVRPSVRLSVCPSVTLVI